jgi:predicted deacetylase
MSATYLVRIDDVCPTMNWPVWSSVEATLIELGIRPMLAVVPANEDPVLAVDEPNPRFWELARTWQARGWTIALHGFRHRFLTGEAGVVGINPRSEFAGLPRDDQRDMLQQGLEVFRQEGLRAGAWIAPAHSFDLTTVEVLRSLGVGVVSDGLGLFPFVDAGGTTWVPQQLWHFRPMPFGVWTVCIHLNAWMPEQVTAFARDLARHRSRISDLDTVVSAYQGRRHSWTDAVASRALLAALNARRTARSIGRPPRQADRTASSAGVVR